MGVDLRLILSSIFFTIALPGVGVIALPYGIHRLSGSITLPELSLLAIILALLWIISAAVLLHCIWGFAFYGKGTLAPLAPPKVLVVRGLYRYTRNPMYLAVICLLLIEGILFASWGIHLYAGLAVLGLHQFVTRNEEPRLRKQFGDSFEEYCLAVPRWRITSKPY